MEKQISKLSRRECIKMSLLGAGSLALGGFYYGCAGKICLSTGVKK